MIDLRSDTITLPTPEMREAMAQAPVGDDVFSDDPTVNTLEERVAEMLGKEAAVYLPSGTMTNQVAVRTHTKPGDEILLDENAHIYFYEGGGTAALSGAICRLIPGERGIFGTVEMETVLRPVDVHYPRTKLVCLENTTNRGGGKVWPLEKIAEVENSARKNNLKMHLDGARLWNAAIALQVPEAEITRYFDSVSVCFSKGLGAPVGSALVGSHDFILEARRFRKQFGGGMRQAGIIAAGALYALENNRKRLAEDHANAKMFANGLAEIQGIEINPDDVETNIVMFGLTKMSSHDLLKQLGEQDTHMLPMNNSSIRAVTNLMVTEKQIPEALEQIRKAVSE
ncbi:MAG TPA: low-specificity L-threonine aldolase [Candidatus Lambdaproteobacteria bacterium]|nr:low-specificity L-threonine aldolase [Deltaproteobacteria bacterium]HHZ77544.1 low-specificity L-threonine aldolase [Candidatus Lambdaproteobacteria bacterium]HIA56962.1 low-specificity L-threonine aldolase [Candidatus Lambdaproteobacteria bacterium]HIB45681.1 low-specificity L-threonine aldolase [Candidatus Lambdaproteobacteria bacterium]HIB92737.1 low-specificity L-threonine aldolase [Candidatus Lambdaproteobacteria bacterium]